jgi:4-amino-4-deoxy-L-arabinose transferase-like glycosyltransferase
MRSIIEPLLTRRGVVAFWLLYALSFVLMLWAVSPGRTLQDALSAELLQNHLAGGYQLRNPPLYEWLLWGVQRLVGTGPLSYLLLRYALIAVIGILFYVALRRAVSDARLAAAFSLSLLLFYWFGWEAHHSVSHTLVLLVLALACFSVALAYAEQRTMALAIALGLVIGFGLMAKWSFALLLLSLGAALALTPATRRLYADPHTLLVPLASLLPVLPFVLWLFDMQGGVLAGRSLPQDQALSTERALQGMAVFLTGIPLVFLPWILFVLLYARRNRQDPGTRPLTAGDAIRIALLTAGIGVVLMAAMLIAATVSGAVLFGITRFAIHYLYPFCLFAALGIAGMVATRVEPRRFGWALALTSLIAAVAIFVLKLASFYVLPGASEATNLLPYRRLAGELERRGLGTAQFVTLSPREAGNLAIYLPEARALSLSARIEPPPPDPVKDRPCLFLWGGESFVPPAAPPPSTPSPQKLLKPLGLGDRETEAIDIDVDWDEPLIGARRRSVWHILQGPGIDPVCRRLAAKGMR